MQEKLSTFCGFDESSKTLTGLYCKTPISSQELGEWFSSVSFEALPPDQTCMAAIAGAAVQFADVPDAEIPRLRGIIKYVHTLNSGMFSGVCALGAACNRAQIRVLLMEDTALYMRYPDMPQRHLWQTCIGVRMDQYKKVLDLAQENGFEVEHFPNAAVARQGVVRQIVIKPVEDNSFLWSGAEELKKGNAVFLCPEPAAILIETCQRTFRALLTPKPRISVVRWCMDMKILSDCLSDSDWIRGKAIAEREHAHCHMGLLFAIYHAVTGLSLKAANQFGTTQDARRTFRLVQAYVVCPKNGHKLRRTYLLYRLRRPDSIIATARMLLRLAFRKFKG